MVSAAWNNQVFETGCDSALEKLSIGVSSSCEAGSRSWQFRAEILVSRALESWKCLSTCCAEDLSLQLLKELIVSLRSPCRDIVVSPALVQLDMLISSCRADWSFSGS